MIRTRRHPGNMGLGLAGTVMVHGLVGALLFAEPPKRHAAPPAYKVRLLAAPEADPNARKAPEAVDRAAAAPPAPLPNAKPMPKSTASKTAPPPEPDAVRREAAPRTTPKVPPLPGETPSTGSDLATVSTEGVEFPFPEYLQNVVTQVRRRWQQPYGATPQGLEVSFLIRRDGSITNLEFVKRSGNFAFDLEAEGAVEEAGRQKVFGPLPTGWQPDVLFVRFFFGPTR